MAKTTLSATVQYAHSSSSSWNDPLSGVDELYVGGGTNKFVSRIGFTTPSTSIVDGVVKIKLVTEQVSNTISTNSERIVGYLRSATTGHLSPSSVKKSAFTSVGNPYSTIQNNVGTTITGIVARGKELYLNFNKYIKPNVTYWVYLFPENDLFGQVWLGAQAGKVEITLEYTEYTSPSAPTSASIKGSNESYIIKPSDDIVVSWSGAGAGTNNAIRGYSITVYDKSASPSTVLTTKTVETTNKSGSIKIPLSGLTRGHVIQAYIITLGEKANTKSDWKYTSNTVAVNTLPAKPSGVGITVGSTIESATLSVTAGATNDSGQSASIWYSNTSSGDKQKFYSNTTSLPTPNTGNNLYYFWTFDGLEYSEPLQLNIFRIDKPKVNGFSITKTTFTPYESVTGVSYVTKIKISDVLYDSLSVGEELRSYGLYISYSDKEGNITGNGFSLMKTYTNSTFTVNISDFVGAGKYFRIAITIVNNFGDESPKKECDDVFACGRALIANDFSGISSVFSNIDNDKNTISSLSKSWEDCFSNYIKIKWTNPSNIADPCFRISSITLGCTDSNGNFISCSSSDKTASKAAGGSNDCLMTFTTSPARGSVIYPAIRVTPINGSPFNISSGEKRTRVFLPELRDIKITPSGSFFDKEGNYLDQNEKPIFSLTIIGSLTKGGTKTLPIDGVSASLTSDLLGKTYGLDYTIESENWSVFSLKDKTTFVADLWGKGQDERNESIFRITVADPFRNSSTTKDIEVPIDFRVAPVFPDKNPSIKVGIYPNIDIGKSLLPEDTDRYLNPGEKIYLTWPAAKDPGKGDPTTVKYVITSNVFDTVTLNTQLTKADNDEMVVNDNQTYTYTIPFGSTNSKKITFSIIARDKSGLETELLSTKYLTDVYIARAVAPTFEIVGYSIDDSGILTGTIKITDYGDDSANNISNYSRCEMKLSVIDIDDTGKTNYDITIDENGIFNPIDITNKNSGKILLEFTYGPTLIGSPLLSTKQYLFTFSGPTFSYRSHQIGINAKADSEPNAALIVGGNQEAQEPDNQKTKIYFLSMNEDGFNDMIIDLKANALFNFIIDGGDNAWSNTTNTTET